MQVTNKRGLPAPFVRAAESFMFRSNPDPTKISVSALIGPPRIKVLRDQHWDELEEDASERLWAVMGSAVHQVLESADERNSEVLRGIRRAVADARRGDWAAAEELWLQVLRQAVEMDQDRETFSERFLKIQRDGWEIRGVCDYLGKRGILSDWKLKKAWGYVFGVRDGFPDIQKQMNLYAHMLREEGEEVRGLEAVMIFRDWDANRIDDGEYPSREIERVTINMWEPERCEEFIAERLAVHKAALEELPECTDDERWFRPGKFAVYSRKSKAKKPRALRLLDTQDEAVQWMRDNSDGKLPLQRQFRLEHRPGEHRRCKGRWTPDGFDSFCPVFEFCEQGRRLVNGG